MSLSDGLLLHVEVGEDDKVKSNGSEVSYMTTTLPTFEYDNTINKNLVVFDGSNSIYTSVSQFEFNIVDDYPNGFTISFFLYFTSSDSSIQIFQNLALYYNHSSSLKTGFGNNGYLSLFDANGKIDFSTLVDKLNFFSIRFDVSKGYLTINDKEFLLTSDVSLFFDDVILYEFLSNFDYLVKFTDFRFYNRCLSKFELFILGNQQIDNLLLANYLLTLEDKINNNQFDTSTLAKSSELTTLESNIKTEIANKQIDTSTLAKSSELTTLETNLNQKIADKTISIDSTQVSSAVTSALDSYNFNVTADNINLENISMPTLAMIDVGGQFGSRFAKGDLVDYRYLDGQGNVVAILRACKVLWCVLANVAIGKATFLYGLEFTDSETQKVKTLNAFEDLLSKYVPTT